MDMMTASNVAVEVAMIYNASYQEHIYSAM